MLDLEGLGLVQLALHAEGAPLPGCPSSISPPCPQLCSTHAQEDLEHANDICVTTGVWSCFAMLWTWL
eukprot:CAMPEP_0178424276 /NCGR_PEP_ID=MMETSP0689_2-20121128/28125_1 /TAXON_ID=160604 /ORGANISM="Amphidinium massartii, Strain CS-259" /LENGTH=67 /DNA_ID=CAMNT_0020045905 /DNA_START=1347 /DNA_END=1550 /DNA_ORIENTATION=+